MISMNNDEIDEDNDYSHSHSIVMMIMMLVMMMIMMMMSNYKPLLTYELMNEFQSCKNKKRDYQALIVYNLSDKDDNNKINSQYASIVCKLSDGYDNLPVINTIMR